jgi:Flp pilus assembly protein TadB
MIDPVYAIPGFLVFTAVGYLVFFNLFIKAPYRGIRHIFTAVSPKSNSKDKEESKEVIADAGRRASSYLLFYIAALIGLGLYGAISTLGIVILNVAALIVLGVLLFLIYVWAQNRI